MQNFPLFNRDRYESQFKRLKPTMQSISFVLLSFALMKVSSNKLKRKKKKKGFKRLLSTVDKEQYTGSRSNHRPQANHLQPKTNDTY